MTASLLSPELRDRSADIRERFARIPRVRLALVPTPMHEAPQLAARLGGPRIFVKRDDLTGVALGGNKTRNLEFRLAHALKDRPDVVVVGLDLQSNSARQTIGCCNKLGLRTILVLEGARPNEAQGNLLIDYLLGADVRFAADRDEQRRMLDEAAAEVRARGLVPHILNDNPMFDVASALAYIECTIECLEQLAGDGVAPRALYMSSSGKGQAGLVLARRLLGADFDVRCITATREFSDVPARTAEIANQTAAMLGLQLRVTPSEISNFDGYVGEGYGIPSRDGTAAVKLFAETEGIVLDPVYTGKCAAGMIDHIRRGDFTREDVVVFIHTGGTPAVFTHHHLWM
jgi:1-aminocyclopropane-1-carboxylate deaminase/D-cysteine desulfhydrase-like pyridoxal-dependent ACC family enzyme